MCTRQQVTSKAAGFDMTFVVVSSDTVSGTARWIDGLPSAAQLGDMDGDGRDDAEDETSRT